MQEFGISTRLHEKEFAERSILNSTQYAKLRLSHRFYCYIVKESLVGLGKADIIIKPRCKHIVIRKKIKAQIR